jgi:hypothetical protein
MNQGDHPKNSDEGRGAAAVERRTPAQEDRAEAQERQLDAQRRGDIAGELREFAHEVVDDHRQFAGDVAEDARNPERREGERQGVPPRPGHEPRPKR